MLSSHNKKTITINLTDLQVAKTNRGTSVSQVLKYYRCQKNEINKVTVFLKKERNV